MMVRAGVWYGPDGFLNFDYTVPVLVPSTPMLDVQEFTNCGNQEFTNQNHSGASQGSCGTGTLCRSATSLAQFLHRWLPPWHPSNKSRIDRVIHGY
jgi:hypothetical protein